MYGLEEDLIPISNVCSPQLHLLCVWLVDPLTHLQFENASLHPVMVENIKLYNYDKPTPIQSFAIPAILQGHDLLSCARTGKKPNATLHRP